MTEAEAIKVLEKEKAYMDSHGGDIQSNALGMAIEAMEKQIAKKIHEEAWIYTKCDCGYEFSKHHGDGYYTVPYHKKTNYCPNCGQKLDWSEV